MEHNIHAYLKQIHIHPEEFDIAIFQDILKN